MTKKKDWHRPSDRRVSQLEQEVKSFNDHIPLTAHKRHSKKPNSFEIPRYLIYFGKALQFFSTDLAASFAAKFFSTPLKFPVPEREMMMRNSAKKERLKVPGPEVDVQVYVYGYSKRKVLLVHGWAGRGTQLFQLADRILENRMMVISFDGPAHGLSTGKRTSMPEFLDTIKAINAQYGPFDAAIGHSFGGMSLINAVANGLKVEKLVTIGADNSVPEAFEYFVRKMELKPIVAKKLENLFTRKFNFKPNMLTSDRQAARIKTPTLVIHDSNDRIVDVSSAVSIRQSLINGELLITNGLGHHKIFRDSFVIRRIIDFIQ